MNQAPTGPQETPRGFRDEPRRPDPRTRELRWDRSGEMDGLAEQGQRYVTDSARGSGPTTGPLRIGSTFGAGPNGAPRYTITGFVGGGGTGEIYRVVDAARGGMEKALKVALIPGTTDPEELAKLREAFEREVRACEEVQSTHTVKVYGDLFAEFEVLGPDGRPATSVMHAYLMRLYEHGDLRANMDAGNPFILENAYSLCADICQGVADMHDLNIAHADIKPENVFLDARSAKVADFGLSLHREDEHRGTVKAFIQGTPGYISPELIERKGLGLERDDVYALGCVAFEILTGGYFPTERNPEDPWGTLAATASRVFRHSFADHLHDLDGEVSAMIRNMLASEKTRPTAREAADLFRRFAADKNKRAVNHTTDLSGMLGSKIRMTGMAPADDARRLEEKGILLRKPERGTLHTDHSKVAFTAAPEGTPGLVRRVARDVGFRLMRWGSRA